MEEIFVLWCSHRIVGLQLEWTSTFTCTESFGLIRCKIRLVEISRRMSFCVVEVENCKRQNVLIGPHF